jgi:type I restriction enzyme S subunit
MGAYNVALIKTVPNLEFLDRSWFYHFLISDEFQAPLLSVADRSAQAGFSKDDIYNFSIPVPPLPEQHRIVAILDEAFAAIATARANAEQNLKNARELFESHLQQVFSQKGEGWVEVRFEDCIRLKSGENLTSKQMSDDGLYPVFGGNGIAGKHDSFNLSGDNVIIGRVGALCGNVRHIREKIWLTDNAFKVVDMQYVFDNAFLTYLLNNKDLRSYARQAAQPVISNSSLKDVLLKFPKDVKEQSRIVYRLDALRSETQRLEAIYQQKITALDELKKSLLHQAFSGAL